MAIAHDSASSGTGLASTTCSWSHTLGGGSNLVLVVGIATDNGSQGLDVSDTSSVTYGGQSLTKVASSTKSCNDFANNGYTELWYLIAPSGNQTVTVTFANSCNAICGAEVFSGAHQTSPLNTVAKNFGSSATAPTVSVTSATDEISIAVCCDNKGSSGSPGLTNNAGTQRWNADASAGSMAGAGQTIAGSATASHAWIINTTGGWSASGISIKPAASGSVLDISQGAFANFVASGRSFAASAATQTATASFTASGRSTASGQFAQSAVATFIASGRSTSAGSFNQAAVASLADSGSATAAGQSSYVETANVVALGTSTGASVVSQSAIATFSATSGSAAQAGDAAQAVVSTFTASGSSTTTSAFSQAAVSSFTAAGSGIDAGSFSQSVVAVFTATGSTAVQVISAAAAYAATAALRFVARTSKPSTTTWGTRANANRKIIEEEQQRDEAEVLHFIRAFYDSIYTP